MIRAAAFIWPIWTTSRKFCSDCWI